jgi:YHS domain-containing protein
MKSMNKKIMLTVAAVGFFFLMGNLSAKEAPRQPVQDKKAQTECPVLGEKIDKSLFVDFMGKRIYVCCAECVDKVKEDPEKYIKDIETKGIVLDKTVAETPKAEKKKASCH